MELGSGCAMKSSGCYFIAASTARLAMTVIRCARYSGLACRSLLRPSAFTLILATDSGANFAASAFSMSAWRNAQGPAPVTPTRTLPPKRSEEHTSELQSQSNLVCRLLLENKKDNV